MAIMTIIQDNSSQILNKNGLLLHIIMKKFSCIALLALSSLTLLLTACLVPEKFSAVIKVAPDASYTFKYSGITAYIIALPQADQSREVSERDTAMFRADAEKMLKRPEFKKAEYLNNGRYDIEIEYDKKPGESLKMFDAFSVSTDKSGIMTVSTTAIKPKDRQQLETMGVQINGKLSVSLPRNAEVISHNATTTPYFWGWLGDYSWDIQSFDQRPEIKFKFNPVE